MIVLAKAVKGKEFCYIPSSSHQVSKAPADVICKALNELGYQLGEGEVWHKFENFCRYSSGWDYAVTQKFTRYKNRIRETKNYYGF